MHSENKFVQNQSSHSHSRQNVRHHLITIGFLYLFIHLLYFSHQDAARINRGAEWDGPQWWRSPVCWGLCDLLGWCRCGNSQLQAAGRKHVSQISPTLIQLFLLMTEIPDAHIEISQGQPSQCRHILFVVIVKFWCKLIFADFWIFFFSPKKVCCFN